MLPPVPQLIAIQQIQIASQHLQRKVTVDCYLPNNVADPSQISLLIINDGQDLVKMNFSGILNELLSSDLVLPILCVGVHASEDRLMEYGTAGST
jgi:enterochelin esterase family protein